MVEGCGQNSLGAVRQRAEGEKTVPETREVKGRWDRGSFQRRGHGKRSEMAARGKGGASRPFGLRLHAKRERTQGLQQGEQDPALGGPCPKSGTRPPGKHKRYLIRKSSRERKGGDGWVRQGGRGTKVRRSSSVGYA